MPLGVSLIEIHSPYLSIDGLGNLVLNTSGKLAEQVKAKNVPGLVGAGIPSQIAISNAAGGTQYYSDVAFQVQDALGNAIAGVVAMDVWLSDAATGIGLTATTPSGGISAEATDGAILGVSTTSKALRVQTNAAGLFGMQIIDSAKTGFYPCAALANQGATVGAQLTTASYHA